MNTLQKAVDRNNELNVIAQNLGFKTWLQMYKILNSLSLSTSVTPYIPNTELEALTVSCGIKNHRTGVAKTMGYVSHVDLMQLCDIVFSEYYTSQGCLQIPLTSKV